MTNLAIVLTGEISRLARKEARAEVSQLRTIASQQRTAIAALRKELEAVRKQLRAFVKQRADAPATDATREPEGGGHRFRAQGVASHRKRLGLSAEDFGKLIGVTHQSIYKWEQGRARPRAAQIEALASVRTMGKRAAASRLQELAAQGAQPARRPDRARRERVKSTSKRGKTA